MKMLLFDITLVLVTFILNLHQNF